MADEEKDLLEEMGIGGGDGPTGEMSLDGMDGLDAAGQEDGRPLPKKVELDIDEMMEVPEEDLEEEAPEEEPEEEAPVQEEAPEEEPPPARISRSKLAVLAGGGLLIVLAVASVLIMLLGGGPAPLPIPKVLFGSGSISQLKPFVINVPQADRDVIVTLTLDVTFSDKEAKGEFENRLLVHRDAIFRLLLTRDLPTMDSPKARNELAEELVRLIGGGLSKGRVERVKITELTVV
ncbi:MAG: flagellar basal body-associated FliL family protein [Proteobacteria bacterium]|nr:flagellar basal body-associated FliL family protein [Pseudomonadota bacterium]